MLGMRRDRRSLGAGAAQLKPHYCRACGKRMTVKQLHRLAPPCRKCGVVWFREAELALGSSGRSTARLSHKLGLMMQKIRRGMLRLSPELTARIRDRIGIPDLEGDER